MSDLNELKEIAYLANEAGQGSPAMVEFRVSATPDVVIVMSNQLEAAQQRIAELEEQKGQWVAWAKEGCAIADDLKSELARRDASAGEPASAELSRLREWVKCVEAERDKAIGWHSSLLKKYNELIAAQPSALPHELTEPVGVYCLDDREGSAWMAGANWMRDQAKALGCKAIKLAKDLKLSDKAHQSHVDYAEGYNDRAEMDRQALRALGFTVEGE